jgi:hypothetical protein
MSFRIDSKQGSFGEIRYYILKRYNFYLFRIWLPIIVFRFPFIFRLSFLSPEGAKYYISIKQKIAKMPAKFFPKTNNEELSLILRSLVR